MRKVPVVLAGLFFSTLMISQVNADDALVPQGVDRDQLIANELQKASQWAQKEGEEQTQEKFQKIEQQIANELSDEKDRDEFNMKIQTEPLSHDQSEELTQEKMLERATEHHDQLPPVDLNTNVFEVVEEPAIPSDVRSRLKKIEVALQFASHEYHANQNSDGEKFEKNGNLYGVYAAYTYRRPYKVPVHTWKELSRTVEGPGQFPTFMRMEGDISFGEVDYSSFSTGQRGGYGSWQLNVRMLGGYDFLSQDSSFIVTPYVGIGFRRFSDKAGGWIDSLINDYVEYENVYNYIYMPIGVETVKHFNENWDLGLKFEGSLLLGGTIDYNLSDIEGLYTALDADTGLPVEVSHRDSAITLKSGFGIRSSVKLIRSFERVNVFTEPFLEVWKLNKSKANKVIAHGTNGQDYESVSNPLFEPANYTLQLGLRLGVQF